MAGRAGRAQLGVGVVWARGGPLSQVRWPKLKLMLGWKGRLKERFVVDIILILRRDCDLRSLIDVDGVKKLRLAGKERNAVAGEKTRSPTLACQ